MHDIHEIMLRSAVFIVGMSAICGGFLMAMRLTA